MRGVRYGVYQEIFHESWFGNTEEVYVFYGKNGLKELEEFCMTPLYITHGKRFWIDYVSYEVDVWFKKKQRNFFHHSNMNTF